MIRPATTPDAPPGPVPVRDEPAPAKINLALHVTGRRPDGYHLLDSLVVFTELGDRVTVAPGPPSLRITGPFADDLPVTGDNLCLRAARSVGADAAITLYKALPVASGIGGGSADAAAVLRALGRRPAAPEALGADVPVCLASVPARMRGLGEIVDPLPGVPALHLVLVNPRVPVSTPEVFRALRRRDNPGLPDLPAGGDAALLVEWLKATRNDLQPPAIGLAPVIADALAALVDAGAALARMSGSGATCFGIFPDAAAALRAAQSIAAVRPGWWIADTRTLPSPARPR
ncbi:4-diphosphocytidyl-2-C-methyl-D-erythritol kinase [Paracoccus marinus]|nr:4-diphosphocytidyl-2-C-methyl-D-erythritol kinase [Paracoccus marinus]